MGAGARKRTSTPPWTPPTIPTLHAGDHLDGGHDPAGVHLVSSQHKLGCNPATISAAISAPPMSRRRMDAVCRSPRVRALNANTGCLHALAHYIATGCLWQLHQLHASDHLTVDTTPPTITYRPSNLFTVSANSLGRASFGGDGHDFRHESWVVVNSPSNGSFFSRARDDPGGMAPRPMRVATWPVAASR